MPVHDNTIKSTFLGILKEIKSGKFLDHSIEIMGIKLGFGDRNDNLTDDHIILLAEALKKAPHITEVILHHHSIGDIGATHLASIPSLQKIDLTGNSINPKGIKALCSSKLQTLILNENFIFQDLHLSEIKKTVDHLINNKTIKTLCLNCCIFPNQLVSKLIRDNDTIKRLTLNNDVGDEAFKYISNNKVLEELCLPESHYISNQAILYILENKSLKKLFICKSEINDEGAKLISQHTSIKDLTIYDSNITFGGAKIFIDNNLEHFEIHTIGKYDVISYEECEHINSLFLQSQNERKNNNKQEDKSSQVTNISTPDTSENGLKKKRKFEQIDKNQNKKREAIDDTSEKFYQNENLQKLDDEKIDLIGDNNLHSTHC